MHKISKLPAIIYLLTIISIIPVSTYSLTVVDVSTEDLTRKSELVVKGKVIYQECKWENEKQNAINTFSTIQVEDYLKGKGQETIIVKQEGGQIGDTTDVIDGAPCLEIGEEVILFLTEFKGDYVIFSMALGCYKIKKVENSKKFAVNDLRNVNLIVPEKLQKESTGIKIKSFVLNDFLREVNSSVD